MHHRRIGQGLVLWLFLLLTYKSGSGQSCPCSNPLLSARESFAAAVVEGNTMFNRAFVFGGKNASGTVLNTAERLTGSVQCLYPAATFALPAGGNFGATAIYSNVTQKVYLFGGNNGASDLSTVWQLDPVTLAWTAKASMSIPRSYAAGAEINGLIYIAGGRNGATVLSSHQAYDPLTDTWVAKAPLPSPTWGHKYLRSATTVYPMTFPYANVLGGRNQFGVYQNQNLRYDPVSNSWTSFAPMPTPLAFFAGMSCYLPSGNGGHIAILGGESSPGTVTSAVSIFDPITNSWYPPTYSYFQICYPASHYEAIQTGDLINLYISHMSMGGRMNGGAATNQLSLVGFWAVMDGEELDLKRSADEGGLIWNYTGELELHEVSLQVLNEQGEVLEIAEFKTCEVGCREGEFAVPSAKCGTEACHLRLTGNKLDGSQVFSNVLEIEGQLGMPEITQDEASVSIFMPEGLDGTFSLVSMQGSVLRTGKLLPGIESTINLDGLAQGIYLIQVRTPKGAVSERIFHR